MPDSTPAVAYIWATADGKVAETSLPAGMEATFDPADGLLYLYVRLAPGYRLILAAEPVSDDETG